MVIIMIVSIISTVAVAYFVTNHTTQMIGFDPYEILGVERTDPVNAIKKAYRYYTNL
jgi:preprotein translocase subunit Sec63